MKKKILLLMGVFSLGLLQAQVGINTTNPFGWLHVDTQANTGGTIIAPTNDTDDIIVTNDGRIGIGTANPRTDARLDILGRVRIQDGNELNGRVLVSNANGLASWSDSPASITTLRGVYNNTNTPIGTSTNKTNITQTPINLTEGLWLVMAQIVASNNNGGALTPTNFHTWIELVHHQAGGTQRIIDTGATRPEATPAGSISSSAQLISLVNVTNAQAPMNLQVHAYNDSNGTLALTNNSGGSFIAFRITSAR